MTVPEAALRVLVTGAAGSGTSTLAAALARELGALHLEADDHFWVPGDTPYRHRRPPAERAASLRAALDSADTVVVAGSVVDWGDEIEHGFDLVVFLYLPTAVRLARLQQREMQRFGRVDPAFLQWAADYDGQPAQGRSLARHRAWLASRRCPVIELDGDQSVAERLKRVRPHLRRRTLS